jgi:hypothetical protein
MGHFEVLVEFLLQGFLVGFAIRPMTGAFRSERCPRANGANRLHRNVSKPFRHSQRWFLHARLPFFVAADSPAARSD